METNPTIGDQPENNKVIEFRIPENWVPPKLRPRLAVGQAESREANREKPDTNHARQPEDVPNVLTQSDLEELAALKKRHKETLAALQQQQDLVTWCLLNGVRIEPGPRVARLMVMNRAPNGRTPGASWYRLIAR